MSEQEPLTFLRTFLISHKGYVHERGEITPGKQCIICYRLHLSHHDESIWEVNVNEPSLIFHFQVDFRWINAFRTRKHSP